MNKRKLWSTALLLVLMAMSLQGCLGIGENTKSTTSGGKVTLQVKDGQNFSGHLYFTKDRQLYLTESQGKVKQLSEGKDTDVRDPAVSSDGKQIAFIQRYKNYSNLMVMSTQEGWSSRHTLMKGDGPYAKNDANLPISNANWYSQPAWSTDGTHLLFLSDLQKFHEWPNNILPDAPFLDPQVFSIPVQSPPDRETASNQNVVAYAAYGDGGDRDPQFRPGSPNEVLYTHYQYDTTGTKQEIQIYLTDSTLIGKNPGTYTPVQDAGVAITPTSAECLQPEVSPDGKAVAFLQRNPATNTTELRMMTVPDNVTANPNDKAGTKKALDTYSKSVTFSSQQFISQPVWSPDGKQLAYLNFADDQFNLWIANLEHDPGSGLYKMKGDPIQVTDGGIDGDSRPVWTR